MLQESYNMELSDKDFTNFRTLVYEKCGIYLHAGKKELVRARLGKRLRETNFPSFQKYYAYLTEKDSGEELAHMLDAISTNLTSFFRESNHFEFLQNEILPSYRKPDRDWRFHGWSAGCSSGEEPYSLAMCLCEYFGRESQWRIKILATDISTKMLTAAVSGVYHQSRAQTVPTEILKKYFQKGQERWEEYVRIKPYIKNMVDFRRLNLMADFEFKEKFDVIFCRNVMIYFDKAGQESLVKKFYESLNPGGHLLIGHSESLLRIQHPFKYIKPTIYRKS